MPRTPFSSVAASLPQQKVSRAIWRLRLIAVLIGLISSAAVGLTQSVVPVAHDGQVTTLVARILAANSQSTAMMAGTSITGHIRRSPNGETYPVRMLTLGNDRSRTEIDWPEGTTVHILNQGKATFQSAKGRVRQLHPINTLSERITWIPSLSLLQDVESPQVQSEWIGTTGNPDSPGVQFALSWSNANGNANAAALLKAARTVFTVDPQTLRVLAMEFTTTYEGGTGGTAKERIAYSNFKQFNGVWLASTITTTINAQFLDEVDIDSISLAPPDASSFVLPAVTK